jgi:hypothetical protein
MDDKYDAEKSADNILLRLQRAIDETDIKTLYLMLAVFKDVLSDQFEDISIALKGKNAEEITAVAERKIVNWRKELATRAEQGLSLDVYYPPNDAWFEARIQQTDGENILVYYPGWKGYDQWVSLTSVGIAPHGTFTARRVPAEKRKSADNALCSSSEERPAIATAVVDSTENLLESSDNAHNNDSSGLQSTMLLSATGRVVRQAAAKMSSNIIQQQEVAIQSKAKKPRSNKGVDRDVDDHDWLCYVCNLLESVDGSDLVLCDGPCRKSVHQGCLKEASISENDELWYCNECVSGRHRCFICGEHGKDFKVSLPLLLITSSFSNIFFGSCALS